MLILNTVVLLYFIIKATLFSYVEICAELKENQEHQTLTNRQIYTYFLIKEIFYVAMIVAFAATMTLWRG